MTFKKWFLSLMALILAGLALIGSITAVIDPFFHYHAPLEGLSYEIFYQRYQNNGILRHFDYDAIIIGNSLSENFSASLADGLFGVNSVKVPFSGASSKEVDQNINTALQAKGDGLRLVIMGVDYPNLIKDKDYMYYSEEDYPTFLFDSNPFNDSRYLLNKNILRYSLNVLSYTLSGQETTSFDAYSNWDSTAIYGRDTVMASYERQWDNDEHYRLDEQRYSVLMGNLEQNFFATIAANPQTQFILFFPPYSILFWDKLDRAGGLELQLEAEKQAVGMLLHYDNVRLFSFMDEFELICDLDRYKDYIHYDAAVNDWMLECMAAGEHEITEANLDEYCRRMFDFYTTFDYDSLFSLS